MSRPPAPLCLDRRRRGAVRAANLKGLDYLEVSENQLTLNVFFLGKGPSRIEKGNVRIEGGRRVRDIQVTDVSLHPDPRPGRDDRMEVRVDRPGDSSTYVLRLVEPSGRGSREWPLRGFDERYASLEFSFKAGCPTGLDCATEPPCSEPVRATPDIHYLARDYAGFRQMLFDRLAVTLPEWRESHVPDLGVTLVELLAYAADYLSQMQDAVATEAYLDTARQRISVRRHARLVDYRMHEGSNARAWISIETDSPFPLDLGAVSFVTRFDNLPATQSLLTWSDVTSHPGASYEVFEALWPPRTTKFKALPQRSEMRFHTWGDAECCLPAGTTEATLRDDWAKPPPAEGPVVARLADRRPRVLDSVAVGDVLIFEEVLGPKTGVAADADPSRRHAVRLTGVRRDLDRLTGGNGHGAEGVPILHVRWRAEDALPFALCLSARLPAPDCGPLEDVSVARGNVVLVDHGRTHWQALPPVPGDPPPPTCDPCEDAEPAGPLARYEPSLERAPVVHAAPLDLQGGAVRLVKQRPREARAQVDLAPMAGESSRPDDRDASLTWTAVEDLLDATPGERRFVVEVDGDGIARLRFSREPGIAPPRGTRFGARYRVGGGTRGNVGAEAIGLLVALDPIASGANLRVRNPLPATGGSAPESIAEVKRLAPGAFRNDRQRAVIAADYAELVARDFAGEVQGAAAALRWNGSWYEARVGVDAVGLPEAPPRLLRRVTERLHRYRRIGHELRVQTATSVPIHLKLEVCVDPHFASGHVKGALLEAFGRRRGAGGDLGFFHPDRLRYGHGVYVSAIVAAAQRVPGVASLQVTRLERWGEGSNLELEKGVLPLGPLEIARLDNDPVSPEHGVLEILTGGGR